MPNQEANLQLSIEKDSGHRTSAGQFTGRGAAAHGNLGELEHKVNPTRISRQPHRKIRTCTTIIVLSRYVAMPTVRKGAADGEWRGQHRRRHADCDMHTVGPMKRGRCVRSILAGSDTAYQYLKLPCKRKEGSVFEASSARSCLVSRAAKVTYTGGVANVFATFIASFVFRGVFAEIASKTPASAVPRREKQNSSERPSDLP